MTLAVKVTEEESTTADGEYAVTVRVPAVPVPLRLIDCVDPDPLRLLSVVTKEPAMDPDCVGRKLRISLQIEPATSELVLDAVELSCGQLELALRLKLAVTFGLFPVAGIEKMSGALPLFATVKVLGLSELVTPTAAEAKVRVGGLWALISLAALLPVSAT